MAGYGFRPIRDDLAAPPVRWFKVNAASYTDNVFNGDLVFKGEDGYVTRHNTTTGATPVAATPTLGVCVGAKYVNADGQFVNAHWYKGSALNTNAYLAVITDPDQLYKIQSDGATTLLDVGNNAPIVNFASSAGSTVTGNSGIQLDDSLIAETGTLACRIVGIVNNGSNEYGTSTVDVIVRIKSDVMQEGLANPTP